MPTLNTKQKDNSMNDRITIQKRGRSFAVVDTNEELIVIAEYRIGAETVRSMVTELRAQVNDRDTEIARQAVLIVQLESNLKWAKSQLEAAERTIEERA